METALIDLEPSGGFHPSLSGLVVNESYSGCALVLVSNEDIQPNQKILAKIGDMDAMTARIVWCKTLEENIKKVGLEFDT